MWRSQLYSLSKRLVRPSTSTARAAAVGVSAGAISCLVVLTSQQYDWQQENTNERDSNNTSNTSFDSRYSTQHHLLPNTHSTVTCCEQQPKHRRPVRLTRHATLRRIEDTSSPLTLESRYKVNWNVPLGEGAFGAVYQATDRTTGEAVAVKKIKKQFTNDQSFQREMNALLHLRKHGGHPNIYALRENFTQEDSYILVFDLVSGGEMFDHLVSQGAYSEADAARLMREVASALAFLHGLDTVHADLKPENILMTTEKTSDSVVKVVDFGCAQVTAEDSEFPLPKNGKNAVNTPAYCPPEILDKKRTKTQLDPSMDMWSLGVILYIMLTGIHPFDLNGNASDEEIKRNILNSKGPPLRGSAITAHLSPDAIDVIEKLLARNPKKRMTALQMLEHPWVRGKTARQEIMADSDKKLSTYRVFKSRLEAQVFEDIVNWSSDYKDNGVAKRMSLLERAFQKLDPQGKGYITTGDLKRLTQKDGLPVPMEINEDAMPLSLSGFSDLLSDRMKNKYYPKGHVIFREGQKGDHMFFINSGTVEVTTKDGLQVQLSQGDFFGEGALLGQQSKRSGTVKCVTPVHVIEISREYFDKYLSESGEHLNLNLREKNLSRKQSRAKMILRLQQNVRELTLNKGDYLYKVGDDANEVFMLEGGKVHVFIEDHVVLSINPGDLCGEHAVLFSRPRHSTSAKCVSNECHLHAMTARDFHKFLNSKASAKETILGISRRREFQKAIVFKTKRAFPSRPEDLRAAFDAADEDSSNYLSLENVRSMLKRMDPSLTEKEVQSILKALDLDESGKVSFEEFKRIFQCDKAKKQPTMPASQFCNHNHSETATI